MWVDHSCIKDYKHTAQRAHNMRMIHCYVTRIAAHLTYMLFPGRLPVADFMIATSLRAYSSSPGFLPRSFDAMAKYNHRSTVKKSYNWCGKTHATLTYRGVQLKAKRFSCTAFVTQASLRILGELSRFTSSYYTDPVTKGNNSRNAKKGFRWCSTNATFE